MRCDFARSVDTDLWVCNRCGAKAAAKFKIPPIAECEIPGLGDRVSRALSLVGITEARVSKLLGRPCGCGKRREALNRLGSRLRKMLP